MSNAAATLFGGFSGTGAKQAALKFLPLRAIGWDVAITPDGPSIFEANSYWDPPTLSENVPFIIDALSSNLPAPGQPANR